MRILKEKGYEIKRGKHLSIKGKEQQRFIRFRSLGDDFSEENLIKAIAGEVNPPENSKDRQEKKQPANENRRFDLVVDIQEKMAQGKSRHWTSW